jgi:pyruvate/2-oxoglutarate/acetoin dehydrogenase E1 component
MNTKPAGFLLGCLIFSGTFFTSARAQDQPLQARPSRARSTQDQPRIVNIVNFIRLLEPRDSTVTEDILYQTVVRQVEMMRANRLGGTFLLQYDALMDPRYQQLLRSLPKDSFDIGAWWEIPQPLVVKAGLPWRGQYPWDWHANIGFSTGYTPEERKKLADVYMADFKKIFGYYPKSAGCWFIDEMTLDYLYHQYGIVASCNCKDQAGTDGYTLWGGYWNQAYYPSKVNAYMPAQDEADAIQVPIFRMLGSDPIRQYDMGVGAQRQGVETLEPVYKAGGGDSVWVNWFFKELVEGESLAFGYTQAGQENSFTWDAMAKGFGIQLPLIAKLRDEKKIRVETLAESGRWFREHYRVTPATAVTVNEDLPGSDRRTVWYDSRFYRANLLWERTRDERTFEGTADTRSDSSVGGSNGMVAMRFRDIHIFNEHFPSPYLSKPVTSNDCAFFTLPVVDGYRWSTAKRTREGAADIRSDSVVVGPDRNAAAANITAYYRELKKENAVIYNTHLYHEGARNILKVPEVKAVYAEDAPILNGYEVLNRYFDQLFTHNPLVVAFGEDLGKIGDVNQGFAGLQAKHGAERIFDTGIRELTIMGQGIGMAFRGLRPIAEIQYIDYLLYGLQPLSDDLATLRYRTAGRQTAPLIVRTRGHRLEGIWHSGSPMGLILHSLRGLHVCVPRNMVQAAGMYNTLLQGADPAIMIECLNGYRLKEKLPANLAEFTVPLGVPEIIKEGEDITLVSYGATLRIVQEAAQVLEGSGISCEVIDVQTLLPFDIHHLILESLKKTSRILIVDEDVPGGAAGFIFNKVMEEQGGYKWLDTAARTITAQAHRPAYSSDGDYFSKPNAEQIVDAVREMMAE